MAEEKVEQNEEQEEGGGKKKLIIIAGAGVALLLVIGVALYFLVLKKPPPEEGAEGEEAPVEAPVPLPEQEAEIGPMVDIKEFVVNILSEDTPHYVKASLSLELDSEGVVEEVNKRMPQIRDAILLLISNKTFEELQDLQGKKQLKAELKDKINSFLATGKVKAVYLTDFVVQ